MLGLPWLRKANPEIDWAEGTLNLAQCPRTGITPIPVTRAQRRCWQKLDVLKDPSKQLWCMAGYTYSTELAEKVSQGKPKILFKDIVPEQYQQYVDVFSEVKSKHLPSHKAYDHVINLKLDTPETICSKVYPMPANEQDKLDQFLEENICKGYIVLSKSLIASLVFFVKKKDGHL